MADKTIITRNIPNFTETIITGSGEFTIDNTPYIPTKHQDLPTIEQVLNPVQLTSATPITFRGEWMPGTRYRQGDYVYLKKRRPGFFYRCTISGTSQSRSYGRSGYEEPGWLLDENVYDNRLIWRSVPFKSIDPKATNMRNWEPNTVYSINNTVRQQNGNPIILEDGTEIVYQLNDIITKLDWPRLPDNRISDGSCEWEACLSIGYFLPKERLKEPTFYEFTQVIDYLILHEQIYFNDFIHKYNDLQKVRSKSLKEIIAESGYNYVSDLLSLNDKELTTLVKYLDIISDLKGSQSGLEVVFNLLDMRYSMQEWWDKNPKGTPHTWDLGVEVEIDKVTSDMISKVVAFTRNYVYPIIENFEITYKMDLAELAIVMAGFIDWTLYIDAEKSGMLIYFGGFYDYDYKLEIDSPVSNYISAAGIIDLWYKMQAACSKSPLLIRAMGTVKKFITFNATVDLFPERTRRLAEEAAMWKDLEAIRARIDYLENGNWILRVNGDFYNNDQYQNLYLAHLMNENGLLIVDDEKNPAVYQRVTEGNVFKFKKLDLIGLPAYWAYFIKDVDIPVNTKEILKNLHVNIEDGAIVVVE